MMKPLRYSPPLDPGFVPAILWNRAYREMAASDPDSRDVGISIVRPDGKGWTHPTRMLPDKPANAALNARYCERLVKLLLWIKGGPEIVIEGAPDMVDYLRKEYSPKGERKFDYEFLGKQCFLNPISVRAAEPGEPGPEPLAPTATDLNLEGCRIGFDLGGSDRKSAALVDGKVIFSEEIKWDPYFQKDPQYHLEGIRDSLQRAAAHLPRVDAIGGSAAGVFINDEPRVSSLFRGLTDREIVETIRPWFRGISNEWSGVPVRIANDGDVAALAGAMSFGENGVLGLSFGTSMATGYITPDGCLTGGINELAFSPCDYREGAPADEWSGDLGCGVQYYSQQGVGRLLPASGIEMDPSLPLPAKLEEVQSLMEKGDARARAIFETIGTCFGYSIPWYAEFFDFSNLIVMGRVTSGAGGDILLETARKVLADEFPEVAEKIRFRVPDETMKRHGQAIAAASLPSIK